MSVFYTVHCCRDCCSSWKGAQMTTRVMNKHWIRAVLFMRTRASLLHSPQKTASCNIRCLHAHMLTQFLRVNSQFHNSYAWIRLEVHWARSTRPLSTTDFARVTNTFILLASHSHSFIGNLSLTLLTLPNRSLNLQFHFAVCTLDCFEKISHSLHFLRFLFNFNV